MKIGISSLFASKKPFQDLLHKIAMYGAECKYWEIVDEHWHRLDQEKIRLLKELKESYNLAFTVHAPFTDLNIASLNPEMRRLSLEISKRSLSNASLLGAEVWVFHPGNHGPLSSFFPGLDVKLNLEAVDELAGYAEDMGIKLGIENMPGGFSAILTKAEEFEGFFQLARPNVGLALDVGHAHIVGQLEAFLRKFSGKIVHVHIHDNGGFSDAHLDVGDGSINWTKTLAHLKSNSFEGILMVESVFNPLQSLRTLREFVDECTSSKV
ncbi:MAG: sugar phosphate isomerase/epimerase [Candidatus Bathyarchaeia archaeon]